MSLRETINTTCFVKKGPTCSMELVIKVLDDDDVLALVGALNNPQITGRAIAQALRIEGHNVRDATVQRHRRGLCQCGDA